MKSYTDIEQSKVLSNILPLESADMFYDGVQDLYKEKVYNIPLNGSTITVRTGHIITQEGIKSNLLLPCWSLTALLNALPNDCGVNKEEDKFVASYLISDECGAYTSDNPIDACYEMIIKLKENKLI